MTHEGSGLALAPKALKDHCKGATVKEGLAIQGAKAKSSKAQIESWAKQI